MTGRLPLLLVAAFALFTGAGPAVAAGDGETDLPFTRSIGIGGVVGRSLGESAAEAGVPPAAMLEALRAFSVSIDLDREVHEGDRFYVRFERKFALDGTPLEESRLLWAELRLAGKKILAIHRFRPRNGPADLYTGAGQSTGAPQLRLPVETVSISSGFGLRVDPMDQPAIRGMGMGPGRSPSLPPSLKESSTLQNVTVVTPMDPPPYGLRPNVYRGTNGVVVRTRSSGGMAMHEGVDLVAPPGTPLVAAGDGVVKGAEPKGRYGNWVEIEHPNNLATVYGHLSGFAPGIVPGAEIHKGDVIGFVGMTGRTTGPHVHFELLVNGRPTNPIVHAALRRPTLVGVELVAFRKVVARDEAERQLEEKKP